MCCVLTFYHSRHGPCKTVVVVVSGLKLSYPLSKSGLRRKTEILGTVCQFDKMETGWTFWIFVPKTTSMDA